MSDTAVNPGGRPTVMTKEVVDKIITSLRAGNYIETAAAFAGIAKKTLYNWLRAGARGESVEAVEFLHAVEKAQAESEIRDLETIRKASETQWQAAAWRLERRHPKRWGRVIEIEDPTSNLNEDELRAKIKHVYDQIASQDLPPTEFEVVEPATDLDDEEA